MNNLPIWLNLLTSFVGGGIVAALISWIMQYSLAATARKRERLYSQLTLFYGPIYCYVLRNEKLFELNKRIYEAYNDEFVGQNFSPDSETQRNVNGQANKTIELGNTYLDLVKANNEKIMQIIDGNFSQCEPSDHKTFLSFYEHYVRGKIEYPQNGLITPMGIYKRMGDISFMPSEFGVLLKQKCEAKQKEYLDLTR